MSVLKFDIYAMVKPKTEADINSLLDEVLNELENVNNYFNKILTELKDDSD
jgi:hypothetical protein